MSRRKIARVNTVTQKNISESAQRPHTNPFQQCQGRMFYSSSRRVPRHWTHFAVRVTIKEGEKNEAKKSRLRFLTLLITQKERTLSDRPPNSRVLMLALVSDSTFFPNSTHISVYCLEFLSFYNKRTFFFGENIFSFHFSLVIISPHRPPAVCHVILTWMMYGFVRLVTRPLYWIEWELTTCPRSHTSHLEYGKVKLQIIKKQSNQALYTTWFERSAHMDRLHLIQDSQSNILPAAHLITSCPFIRLTSFPKFVFPQR